MTFWKHVLSEYILTFPKYTSFKNVFFLIFFTKTKPTYDSNQKDEKTHVDHQEHCFIFSLKPNQLWFQYEGWKD